MSRVGLKQLIGRSNDTREIINTIAAALGDAVTIQDHDGKVLHGDPLQVNGQRYPVTHAGKDIGWVNGTAHARTIASLIDHLVAKEVERKALGSEVLHLYREVNLIYSFSEKLAALLELERVARLTLQEARHLIVASDGVIMLLDEDTGVLTPVAGFGDSLPSLAGVKRGDGVIGAIAATGVAEIVDDVRGDSRGLGSLTDVAALIAAPLKVGERVIGVIALACTMPLAYTAGELKLLSTLALQTATAIENARLFERTVEAARERERLLALHQEVEVARAKLESELELAARIQAALFPSEMPLLAGYELAARNRPARRCGGDYYDALPVVNGDGVARLLLCVADVSGKGLPASLLMSNMQATLRALMGRIDSLPALAERASELLYGSTGSSTYVTAILLELIPKSGDARFVSAGHVSGLWLRANGDLTSLDSTGVPLGLLPPGPGYEETRLSLESGDCLALFSDGVVEAQNSGDDEFGEDRLREILRAASDQPAEAIIARVFDEIDRFAGAAPQFDDITIMVLKKT